MCDVQSKLNAEQNIFMMKPDMTNQLTLVGYWTKEPSGFEVCRVGFQNKITRLFHAQLWSCNYNQMWLQYIPATLCFIGFLDRIINKIFSQKTWQWIVIQNTIFSFHKPLCKIHLPDLKQATQPFHYEIQSWTVLMFSHSIIKQQKFNNRSSAEN